MQLHILHETAYAYRPAVINASHLAYLRPQTSDRQTLLSHQVRIDPTPDYRREAQDLYGNHRLFFDLYEAHDRLRVSAESLVRTHAVAPMDSDRTPAWDRVAQHYAYRVGAACDEAQEFAFASTGAPRADCFAEFAAPSFAAGRPLALAAQDLMNRLHQHMRYEPHSTDIHTPAALALKQGRGVCQDLAHIMLACCRSLGLPARYVSGYLLTTAPPGQARLIGSDASHAWVSVYCPATNTQGEVDSDQAGHWLDLDPTNNRTAGTDYVGLAVGRDYWDVSPLRGVIRGAGAHDLEVSVTVSPLEEDGVD